MAVCSVVLSYVDQTSRRLMDTGHIVAIGVLMCLLYFR